MTYLPAETDRSGKPGLSSRPTHATGSATPPPATHPKDGAHQAPGIGSVLDVTVVVIFLDAERFLVEAIESVFAQTLGSWELLLVDDGSRDGSTALAKRYAAAHPERVRYLDHPAHANRGMSASRNLGLQHARGEFVAFIDADDVWLPEKLERQVALLRARPEVGMLYGAAQYWFSWTGNASDTERDFVRPVGIEPGTTLEPPRLLIRMLQRQARAPHPSGMLVRREVAVRVGGFEDRFRDLHEDQAFVAKVSLAAPVFVSPGWWFRYRQHESSCMAVAHVNRTRAPARVEFLRWLTAYLDGIDLRQTEIRGVVEKQLRASRAPLHRKMVESAARRAPRIARALNGTARRILPAPVWKRARAIWRNEEYVPPAGAVRFGSLRRQTPLSRHWGSDRGRPIDRYYIEQFLTARAADIRGRVLEVGDDTYTRRFGGVRVERSDVLHVLPGNPRATIVADLTCAEEIPSDAFDCVVLTQTLPFIYEARAAIRTVGRILKPGGVVLLTAGGITKISGKDMARWGQYWSFTTLSLRRLLEEVFPSPDVQVKAYGNVLAASAFLYGLAAEELRPAELDRVDPEYELLVAARAVKPMPTAADGSGG